MFPDTQNPEGVPAPQQEQVQTTEPDFWIEEKGGTWIVHGQYAGNCKFTRRIEKGGAATYKDRDKQKIALKAEDEIEIIRRFCPTAKSWFDIDLKAALEQITAERTNKTEKEKGQKEHSDADALQESGP